MSAPLLLFTSHMETSLGSGKGVYISRGSSSVGATRAACLGSGYDGDCYGLWKSQRDHGQHSRARLCASGDDTVSRQPTGNDLLLLSRTPSHDLSHDSCPPLWPHMRVMCGHHHVRSCARPLETRTQTRERQEWIFIF